MILNSLLNWAYLKRLYSKLFLLEETKQLRSLIQKLLHINPKVCVIRLFPWPCCCLYQAFTHCVLSYDSCCICCSFGPDLVVGKWVVGIGRVDVLLSATGLGCVKWCYRVLLNAHFNGTWRHVLEHHLTVGELADFHSLRRDLMVGVSDPADGRAGMEVSVRELGRGVPVWDVPFRGIGFGFLVFALELGVVDGGVVLSGGEVVVYTCFCWVGCQEDRYVMVWVIAVSAEHWGFTADLAFRAEWCH